MNDRVDPAHRQFRAIQLEAAIGEPRNASDNPTMGEIISRRFSRRGVLKGALAVSAISATVSPLALLAADKAKAAGDIRLLVHRIGGRRRRRPSCRRGLRRRRASALGRPALPRLAAVRSDGAIRGEAAPAVRLQQRLHRLRPARGIGGARPACGQPRIHRRPTHVPRAS